MFCGIGPRFPARVVGPGDAEVDNFAGFFERNSSFEGGLYDPTLGLGIARGSRLVTQGSVQESRPGRTQRACDVPCRSHDQGRDSGRFEHSRDQSHGLMADRSGGHQIRQVRLLAQHEIEKPGRDLLAHQAGRVDAAHEAQRRIDHASDHALGC